MSNYQSEESKQKTQNLPPKLLEALELISKSKFKKPEQKPLLMDIEDYRQEPSINFTQSTLQDWIDNKAPDLRKLRINHDG